MFTQTTENMSFKVGGFHSEILILKGKSTISRGPSSLLWNIYAPQTEKLIVDLDSEERKLHILMIRRFVWLCWFFFFNHCKTQNNHCLFHVATAVRIWDMGFKKWIPSWMDNEFGTGFACVQRLVLSCCLMISKLN